MAAFRAPARSQQQHVSTTQQKQQHVQHAASADVATLDALQEQMSAQLDREEEELRMARDNYIAARMGDRPANVDTNHDARRGVGVQVRLRLGKEGKRAC